MFIFPYFLYLNTKTRFISEIFKFAVAETTLLRLPISLATYKRVFLFQSKSPYFPENFLFCLFLIETFWLDDEDEILLYSYFFFFRVFSKRSIVLFFSFPQS